MKPSTKNGPAKYTLLREGDQYTVGCQGGVVHRTAECPGIVVHGLVPFFVSAKELRAALRKLGKKS